MRENSQRSSFFPNSRLPRPLTSRSLNLKTRPIARSSHRSRAEPINIKMKPLLIRPLPCSPSSESCRVIVPEPPWPPLVNKPRPPLAESPVDSPELPDRLNRSGVNGVAATSALSKAAPLTFMGLSPTAVTTTCCPGRTSARSPLRVSTVSTTPSSTDRGGSGNLDSFRAAVKWISALVTPPPGLASAG